jgi:DNA replication protein DnaC
MLGDPDCPHCGGVGYLRMDVPVSHPDFGKLQICVCRHKDITERVRQRLFTLSRLDELTSLTFESFKPRGRKGLGEFQANSLEMAFNQSRYYAQNLDGWLLLEGDPGSGKTHLGAAVANYAVGMGVPTLFLTIPDLLDSLRASFDSKNVNFEERFDEIRTAKLLVMDDFGTQNATPWAQEKLFQIINYRYINKLATVVTTNLSLDEIEERISSRLSDPELVTRCRINAPDYRHPMKETAHSALSSLDLFSKCTFETFTLRKDEGLQAAQMKSVKDAFETAQSFAQKPRGWLVLTGDYATGKTHLAAAIANHRAALGDPPLFIMAPDLLDELRKTFDEKSLVSYGHRFDEIRNAGVLVLDDLSTHSLSQWGREKLFQILNYRYLTEKPTVITIAADALDSLDARLHSRIQDTRLVSVLLINAPPYHGSKSRRK